MGGSPYNYQTQKSVAGVGNFLQVGVYPLIIDAINYITTSSNNYVNTGGGQMLNSLSSSIPLDIEENNILAFTSSDNTKVKFYDVYADGANISPGLGVKFNDSVGPSKYYILYPSSGGLRRTDASIYNSTTLFAGTGPLTPGNTQPIHNGACRLIF